MDKHELAEHGIIQRDGESAKAFRAFRTYLQSPPERRSLRKLEEEGFSRGSLSTWSSKHEWQSRARAFDISLAESGLDSLLGARVSLLVRSIEQSLVDAQSLRDELVKQVPGASVEKLANIITSRVELDIWQAQIVNLLASVEERQHGAPQD